MYGLIFMIEVKILVIAKNKKMKMKKKRPLVKWSFFIYYFLSVYVIQGLCLLTKFGFPKYVSKSTLYNNNNNP